MVTHYRVGNRRKMILQQDTPIPLLPEEQRARKRDILRRLRMRKRKQVKARVKRAVKEAVAAVGGIFDRVSDALKSLKKAIGQGIATLGQMIKKAVGGLAAIAKSLLEGIATLGQMIKKAVGGLAAIAKSLLAGMVALKNWIRRGLSHSYFFVINVFAAIWRGCTRLVFGTYLILKAAGLLVIKIARQLAGAGFRLIRGLIIFIARQVKSVISLIARGLHALTSRQHRSNVVTALSGIILLTSTVYLYQSSFFAIYYDKLITADAKTPAGTDVPIIVEAISPTDEDIAEADALMEGVQVAASEPSHTQVIDLDNVIDEIVSADEADADRKNAALDSSATQPIDAIDTAPVQSFQEAQRQRSVAVSAPETEPEAIPEPTREPTREATLGTAENTAPMTIEGSMAPNAIEAWQRYAVAGASPTSDLPKLVIVIDDLGLSRRASRDLESVQGPLTLAFLPYANGLPEQTRRLRQVGHELMVHMPMQPQGRTNPGRNALLVNLDRVEFLRRLDWNLNRFEGFVGINNHMGSRLTADRRSMELVMAELKTRGLLFLDSLTTSESEAYSSARAYGVPTLKRDIFLDNERDVAKIRIQLYRAEALAKRLGHAIAIGHPYPETIEVLREWAPRAERRGVQLVSLAALMDIREKARKDYAVRAEQVLSE